MCGRTRTIAPLCTLLARQSFFVHLPLLRPESSDPNKIVCRCDTRDCHCLWDVSISDCFQHRRKTPRERVCYMRACAAAAQQMEIHRQQHWGWKNRILSLVRWSWRVWGSILLLLLALQPRPAHRVNQLAAIQMLNYVDAGCFIEI